MTTKICYSCGGIEKDISEFNKNSKRKDGLQTCCRECTRKNNNKSYIENPKRRAKIRNTNKLNVQRNKDYVLDYLKSHPCVDCGISNVIVLEFDHVRGIKVTEIANLIRGYPLKRLINEIAKCDVRCANCHRIKTAAESKYVWNRSK
jgi:hypothetical protein